MANIFKRAERAVSNLIPHEHSAQRRASMESINSQMDLYKQQKDQLHAENEKLNTEKNAERERLHEKQIRSLRRSFRRPGFLSPVSDPGAQDQQPSSSLG